MPYPPCLHPRRTAPLPAGAPLPRRDTAMRRALDLVLAALMGALALPLLLAAAVAVLVLDGSPVLHRSTRIGRGGVPFALWKLRTLRPDPGGPDRASGGHLVARRTRTGPFLRRTRIDELPQLWNVLRGEMALVGVRPPLPEHVALYPAAYAALLQAPPGLTGLATLRLHAVEARRLAAARTADETEAIYARRILPLKLRLDRIHATRRSVPLDLLILARTLGAVARLAVLRPDGPWPTRQAAAHPTGPWATRRTPAAAAPLRVAGPRPMASTDAAIPLPLTLPAPVREGRAEVIPPCWSAPSGRPHSVGPASTGHVPLEHLATGHVATRHVATGR